LNKTPSAETAE